MSSPYPGHECGPMCKDGTHAFLVYVVHPDAGLVRGKMQDRYAKAGWRVVDLQPALEFMPLREFRKLNPTYCNPFARPLHLLTDAECDRWRYAFVTTIRRMDHDEEVD